MFLVALAVLTTVLLFYNLVADIYMIYIKKFPPGPLSLPIIGGLHHLQLKKPHISLFNLAKNYNGILSLRMGPAGRTVFIQDTDMIHKMTKMKAAANRPILPYFELISPEADGIGSCPYSPSWRLQTKIFHNAFSRICETTLEQFVNESLNVLFKSIHRFDENLGCPFDPSKHLEKFTIHLLCKIVYGQHYEDLDDQDLQEILDRDNFLLLGLAPVHPLNLFPWLKHLPLPLLGKIKQAVQKRDALLVKQYNKHFEDYDGNIRDILDVIIHTLHDQDNTTHLTKSQKQHLNKNNMVLSIWTIFTAGTASFHQTLSWIFLYLAKYPEVAAACRQEIASNDTDSYLMHRERFPYTEAVILESLRLSSVIGIGIPHVSTQDITLGDYIVPKGTEMFCHSWYVHHSEKNWKDPEEFVPERFLDSTGQVVGPTALKDMAFLPFGTGVRICIGQKLAMNILLHFICAMLHRYNLKLTNQNLNMEGKISFLAVSPPDYCVSAKLRVQTGISRRYSQT